MLTMFKDIIKHPHPGSLHLPATPICCFSLKKACSFQRCVCVRVCMCVCACAWPLLGTLRLCTHAEGGREAAHCLLLAGRCWVVG